jgi:hypothetical protein
MVVLVVDRRPVALRLDCCTRIFVVALLSRSDRDERVAYGVDSNTAASNGSCEICVKQSCSAQSFRWV